MEGITGKLADIQSRLKAPKGQLNKFGGYRYRSCEDILEAVKPLLAEHGLALVISDTIAQVGDRYYVMAIARIMDGTSSIEAKAFARESDEKKGFDSSQLTGACSSYARKYALGGLFALDDTKDADTMPRPDDEPRKAPKPRGRKEEAPQRNYAKLSELKSRYAAATGTDLEFAGRSIVSTFGNPKDMGDAAYNAMLVAVEQKVKALEEGKANGNQ